MAQKSSVVKITLAILSRILLLLAAVICGAFFFQITIHEFVVDTLKYQLPSGFFGFTFADWDISWFIASSFLAGIFFGTLGKKMDYVFIITFFGLSSLDFLYTENMTALIYSALVAATVIGNVIGFGLKLLKQKYLAW